jgi:hypothetical protein
MVRAIKILAPREDIKNREILWTLCGLNKETLYSQAARNQGYQTVATSKGLPVTPGIGVCPQLELFKREV